MFFLGALLLIYAYLPDNVSLYSDSAGTPVFYITRDAFFYYSFGLVLIVNLLLFVFTKVLDNVPVTPGKGIFSSASFKDSTIIWLEVLISVINLFFVIGGSFMAVYNNRVDLQLENFTYLVYLGVILLAAAILSYLFVLRYRKHQPS